MHGSIKLFGLQLLVRSNYLLDNPFVVISDHRPLQWLDTCKETNSRVGRWAIELFSHQSCGCVHTHIDTSRRICGCLLRYIVEEDESERAKQLESVQRRTLPKRMQLRVVPD